MHNIYNFNPATGAIVSTTFTREPRNQVGEALATIYNLLDRVREGSFSSAHAFDIIHEIKN